MPQDAFTIGYVAKELDAALAGGRVSKIVQPSRDTLLFIIYTRNGSLKLEICLCAKGCRINLTQSDAPAPKTAPGFCMLLRKHLQNAAVTAAVQTGFERIVRLDFDCTSEFERQKLSLYAELMGKYSNAVLVKDGMILGALKTAAIGENTRRVLFTGVKYAPPAPQDKIAPDDLAALKEAFKGVYGDRAKFIADRVTGVAYATALDMVETYGESLTADDVHAYLCGGEAAPCVTLCGGEPTDFKVRSASSKKQPYESVLAAQTAYYAFVTQKQAFEDGRRKLLAALSSALKKQEKKLAAIEKKLAECRDTDECRLKGELITANLYAIARGADSFEAVNYYDEAGGTVKIALDRRLSPADNAQRYYKRYAKLKRTAENVTAQKREADKTVDYLNSIRAHICLAESLCDLEETQEELKSLGLMKEAQETKKREVRLSPFREYLSQGFRIAAGRNNLQNDRLFKSLSSADIWLHTQKYHSAHVGIFTEGKPVPDAVLGVAAEICAYYSDGRAGSKIPVDYTLKKFVKKPSGAPAGFVVYTDYKTVLADPDAHGELR